MSFTKTKLAKAVAIAIAGSALSVAAISDASAAATTMYNLSTAGGADNSSNTTDTPSLLVTGLCTLMALTVGPMAE